MTDGVPGSASSAPRVSGAVLFVAVAMMLSGCISSNSVSVDEANLSSKARAVADGPAGVSGQDTDGWDDQPVAQVDIGSRVFQPGPCGFDVPAGLEPRCGVVVVPADWATGAGEVELAVAVFPSSVEAPASDPVVYLDGGPGSHTLQSIQFLRSSLVEPLAERGDVVFFDQRGVGFSSPRLSCPSLTEARREAEDRPDLTDAELDARFLGSVEACHRGLVGDGVDLTLFGTEASAHDVEAIRLALGYPAWNLHAVSYGTRLGLEVLRRYPDGVRSAVLDSVFPAHVDAVAETQVSFFESFQAVVDACAVEPDCAALGGLDQRIRNLVARYDAAPVTVTVDDWLTGESDDVQFTGEALRSIVIGALYSPAKFGDLPELVLQLEAGDTSGASAFLSSERSSEQLFSDGLFLTVACREEVPFSQQDEVARLAPPDPLGTDAAFEVAFNVGAAAFDTCGAFPVPAAPETIAAPVRSDVPTLLMAGRFDPVTPVGWAEQVAEDLGQSQLVVFDGDSHGLSTTECGQVLVRSFFDNPTDMVDDSCVDGEPVRFLAASVVDVSLVPDTWIDGVSDVELTSVRPEGWAVGSLGGDLYQERSFLDPTQIFQGLFDPSAAESFVTAVAADYNVELSDSVDVGAGWWQRSGRGDEVAIEWFQSVDEGQALVVLLVAPVPDIDELRDQVAIPARDALTISGS